MKKNNVLFIIIVAASLTACKKNGGGATDLKPAVTPVGTNDGTASVQMIGSGGGTIVSSDGELELIIPAGALTANTNITIQPIINHAPGGRRKAYRCLPDGQQFAKNVTLKFHYTEEDAAATKPEYMMAAFQNTEGTWQVVEDIENDAANKTLSVNVNHFTDFSAFDILRIQPAMVNVRTLESTEFEVIVTGMSLVNGVLYLTNVLEHPETWKVNGVTRGDLQNGVISLINGNTKAEYIAPGAPPPINPVTISAEIEFTFYVDGQRFNKGIVTAQAYVIDGSYAVLIETETPINLGTGEKFITRDRASFNVNLMAMGSGTVDHVENSDPTFEKIEASPIGCNTSWDIKGTGFIHLSQPSKIQVLAGGGDVHIAFGLMTGHINPVARTVCPGVGTPGINEIPQSGIDGTQFSFENSHEAQVIERNQLDYKIKFTITPID